MVRWRGVLGQLGMAPGDMDALANDRQGVVVRRAALILACASCHVSPSPVVPAPDASDASTCAVDQRITKARLIRTIDGTPLVLPACLDSGP
jgi:hypothetical protein